MSINLLKARRLISGRLVFGIALIGSISVLNAETLDLETATILDLQKAYDAGLTSEKVVEVYLRRIEAYDQNGPEINSILMINPRASEIARELDAERKSQGARSLLHGVPILVKDNFDTFDMPTTGGSLALKDSTPLYDAFTIKRLRDAGAIILAKTSLDEFARGSTGTSSLGGQTLNPYNLKKIPGGSSAGSGAAVAALFGQVGLGTETGSSIRHPSSKNNLVGFSPSRGLVSRQGIIPISITFDRAGPMARSVTDAAIVMSIMAGTDAADLITLDSLGHAPQDNYLSALQKNGLKGARIGVLRDLFGRDKVDRTAVKLIDDAINVLKEQGATIIDPLHPGVDLWATLNDINAGSGEYKQAINAYFAARGSATPVKNLGELIETGDYLGRLKERYQESNDIDEMTFNADYISRYKGKRAMYDHILGLMERWQLDALVYPFETKPAKTIAEAAPDRGNRPVNHARERGEGNRLSTVTGLPTLVVPAGFNNDGVPVSLEILGKLFDEATVVRLAYAYEQAHPNRKLPAKTPLLGIEKIAY